MPAAAAPAKKRKPVARKAYDQRDVIERHLAKLAPTSPLQAIVASPAVQRRLDAYEQRDAAAESFQWQYKRLGVVALILTTAAIVVGAITLMLPIGAGYEDERALLGRTTLALNLFAFLIVWIIRRRNVVAAWMTSRAKAERLRGMIFERILGSHSAKTTAPNAPLADILSLIEDAHVGYQLGYFMKAKTRHLRPPRLKSLAKFVAWVTFLMSIVIAAARYEELAGLLRGHWPQLDYILGELQRGEAIHIQLGLSVISASMVAALTAWALMNQDERNAALYRLSEQRLASLKAAKDGETAKAAAAGDAELIAAYLRDVRAILEADQQAWQLTRPPDDPALGHLKTRK